MNVYIKMVLNYALQRIVVSSAIHDLLAILQFSPPRNLHSISCLAILLRYHYGMLHEQLEVTRNMHRETHRIASCKQTNITREEWNARA